MSQDSLPPILEQLQSMLQHPHIQQVQQTSPKTFLITYTPRNLHSPYKQQTYHIELRLSENYPSQAPSLRFLEQVYHLNVGYNDGVVRMPVLEDDWSPFLSFYAIVECLDQLLELPDEDYSVGGTILDLWITDRERYHQKVLETVKLCQVVSCDSVARKFSANDSPIKRISKQQKFHTSEANDRTSTLLKNLRQSLQFIDLQEVKSSESSRQPKVLPQMKKTQSQQNMNIIKSPSTKKTRDAGNQTKIEEGTISHIQLHSMRSWENKQSSENKTLLKVNETVNIFLEELNSLEQQINTTKNRKVEEMLRQKQDNQLAMLKNLMEIAEEAKKKMVLRLKQEVQKM